MDLILDYPKKGVVGLSLKNSRSLNKSTKQLIKYKNRLTLRYKLREGVFMYFTVVIPLYNKERHIGRAIQSVISQTYQNFEIIVVDDGSIDNSVKEVIKIKEKDSRIRLIKQKNSGVSSARNKGIEEAKFDYIGFLDADDMWMPNFLESIKKLIEEYPDAGAYATSYQIKKENGKLEPFINYYSFKEKWHGIVEDYFKYSIKTSLISASSVVIPKSIFNKVGKFHLGLKMGEDRDMWLRIALNYNMIVPQKARKYKQI